MKNIIKTIGLAALVGLGAAGCSREPERRVIENPAFEDIFQDGTLAVYANYTRGTDRPDAFIYAKKLRFEYCKPVPYPTGGVRLPYLVIEDGKGTLYLKHGQGLVVAECPIKGRQ